MTCPSFEAYNISQQNFCTGKTYTQVWTWNEFGSKVGWMCIKHEGDQKHTKDLVVTTHGGRTPWRINRRVILKVTLNKQGRVKWIYLKFSMAHSVHAKLKEWFWKGNFLYKMDDNPVKQSWLFVPLKPQDLPVIQKNKCSQNNENK
jgi:hypothetical protein